ncbi:MAG: four helix bundle protein [Candidatus Chaera renei]|uniref:Four helix bundle protein n=1 Tax=Candidatus Chaera renei TaxID=2506947 RepID=A0A4Q0AIN4_9BACT|nr:MAG: four helix bundle protein [Candidatus Chaera renei]
MVGKITSFESLTVWQETQLFAVEVYKATRTFPKEELFAITSQLRRAATSISANIAEGFGRTAVNDKVRFYTMAYGSLLEVKNFPYLSEKLGYLRKDRLDNLIEQSVACQKLINAFKTGLKNGQ